MTPEHEHGTPVADEPHDGYETEQSVSLFRLSFDASSVNAAQLGADATRLHRLQHPNIARVRELRVAEDRGELVVDRMSGFPLSTYVFENAPDFAEIRSLAVQLASALAYLRAADVHGELRLEHVVVDNARVTLGGANLVPYAWISWPDSKPSPIARILQRHVAGSATESQADVFAVGVVMYHMLTGIGADSRSRSETPAILAFDYFVRSGLAPSLLKHGVPSDWDDVIGRAISVQPGHQFESLDLLRAAIAQLSVSSESVEPTEERDIGMFVRPISTAAGTNTRLLSSMAAMGLLLAVAMYGVAWVVLRGHDTSSVSNTPVVATRLHVSGGPLASGRNVRLAWSPVPGAREYRLRFVSVDRHAVSQLTVSTPGYTVSGPEGKQTFVWKVAALVDSRWRTFSRPATFTVPAPRVEVPVLLRPRAGAIKHHTHIWLCWQPVPGAERYGVKIGTRVVRTARSCVHEKFAPGQYLWSVEAVVRGTQLYEGNFSQPRRLTVTGPRIHPLPTVTAVIAVQSVAPAQSAPIVSAPVRTAPASAKVPAAVPTAIHRVATTPTPLPVDEQAPPPAATAPVFTTPPPISSSEQPPTPPTSSGSGD